jgi:UDP-N-acetylmuramate--alanine ligase
VEKSFRKFAELSTNGILANGDDENTVQTLAGLSYVSFGLGEQNRVRAVNISSDWRCFDVVCDGETYCHVELAVYGRHNALNALATSAAAWMLGIPGEAVQRGLAEFRGAGRRMEFKGTINGADVYDDYAHHPGELAATMDSVRAMGYKRVIFAFQPHTYTRTHALFDDFVTQLQKPDVLVLAEIYAARERNTIGISSRDLADRIPGSIYCATLPEVTQRLKDMAQPGDVILTVGAGDIYRAGEALLK